MLAIIYTIFIIISVYLITIIHELGHYIMAKTYGIKNRSFGIAIWGAFVDPDLRYRRKIEKLYVLSGGVILGTVVGEVSIVIGLYTHEILSFLFLTFGFLSLFINATNAIPLFKGNDAYQILNMYFRKNVVSFLFVLSGSIFLIFVAFFYVSIGFTGTDFSRFLFIANEIATALVLILMFIFGKRIETFVPTKEFSKGWHLSKKYMAIIKIN